MRIAVPRRVITLAPSLALAALSACGPRRAPPAPALPAGAAIDGLDPSMRAAERAGHRWWILSQVQQYSEDPSIGVAVLEAVRVGGGRTAIVFRLTNRRPTPLDLTTTKCVLIDGKGNEQPIVRTPTGTIPPGADHLAAYVFETRDEKADPLSMRLVVPDVKTIWPIVLSHHPPVH